MAPLDYSELIWTLSEIPPLKRGAYEAAGHIHIPDLVCYHVTEAANVPGIRERGIEARSSRQSFERTPAVYFFLDRGEIDADAIAILGIDEPVVITVNVPAANVRENMVWDGLYNVGFGAVTAVQYLASVPTEWIKGVYPV